MYGSPDRAERCCPYCGWNESSLASQLYHLYSGKYASGTRYLLFCKKSAGMGSGQKLQEKAGRGLFVALLLFVGIPLPGTGAWTGTLAASLLDMDFKSSVIAVMCGVVLAGVIMGLLSMGVFGALGTIF